MEFSITIPLDILMDDAKLDLIAAQGVTAIDAPIAFIESTDCKTLSQRAIAIKTRGMRIDTVHPRFGQYNTTSLVNQYDTDRNLYLEQLKDVLLRCAIFGVRVVPLHTGGCCVPGAPIWSFETCLASLSELIPCAKEAGIMMALENTFYSSPMRWDGATQEAYRNSSNIIYDDLARLVQLIDAAQSPFVVGCFDVGHAHFLSDLKKDHQAMMPRIALYHLHDNDGTTDSHMTPGYGTLNWDTLAPLIASNPKAMPCFIESKTWAGGDYKSLLRETAALLSNGREGGIRRCARCGHQILRDQQGEFCNCK